MDCMDNMDKLTFSSPFCLLCPLGPKDASLRQKYAVKYKEQMKHPLQFQKQRVLQFKNLSGCRKFLSSSKWLQVSEKWSLLRYFAKISLFSPILKTENTFLFNQKDFFSETNARCPKK